MFFEICVAEAAFKHKLGAPIEPQVQKLHIGSPKRVPDQWAESPKAFKISIYSTSQYKTANAF